MRALFASLCLWLAAPALAQSDGGVDQLSTDEINRELFGVHLYGDVGWGEVWNECIEPDGDTLYSIGGGQSRGRMWSPADGEVCFNYGGANHCFGAYRSEEGYEFRAGGQVWRTTGIRKNVEHCLLSDMIG